MADLPAPKRPRVRPGSMGHVLVADDSRVNRRVLQAMLLSLGFQVDLAAEGAEAVRAASSTRYAAILMDWGMPVLDGYEAADRIRRGHGLSYDVPMIAVTAITTEAAQQRFRVAGIDDLLTKPVRLQALAAVMAKWVPAPPVQPVLDREVIGRLERLGQAAGEDLVSQLTELFLADAGARVAAMREGLSADDPGSVGRSAHSLRGASANIGATDLALLCASLSDVAAADDLADGDSKVAAIEAEFERVSEALAWPSKAASTAARRTS